jgi:hypothetical protein
MATPTTLPAAFVSGNVLTAAQLNDLRGAFRVLQVVQTVKDDTFTSAATTFTDITGFSVTITPSSATSKVLVLVDSNNGWSGDMVVDQRLLRGSTVIYTGAAAGSRPLGFAGSENFAGTAVNAKTPAIFLDSPATTSATTYKVQMLVNTGTGYFNRTAVDRDTATLDIRLAASITAIEISA